MGKLLVGAMLVLGVSACTKVFMQSHEKTVEAEKAGDVAYLTKVCAGEIRLRNAGDKREACDWLKAREIANAPVDCNTIVKVFQEAPRGDDALALSLTKKALECGKVKETFEILVLPPYKNAGYGQIGNLLIDLEEGGTDVEAAWVKYLQDNKGSGFMAISRVKEAMDKINKWLTKKSHLGHCAATIAAATGASEIARVWVTDYYNEAKCKDAAPMVAELLLSETPDHRKWACYTLGVIGSKAMLAKVMTLAQSDAFQTVSEVQAGNGVYGVKSYPVRDACEAAAGKIKLRAM